MKSIIVNKVKSGFYLDSVALMRYSRTIAGMDGVEEAALMMGTPSNRKIMAEAGVLGPEGEKASGGDLIIGIRAENQSVADHALAESANMLEQSTAPVSEGVAWRPRTIRDAVKITPGANLALISVSGDFAAAEARKALHCGLHAMIFSDNVSLAEEVAVKSEARQLGRLVMGPDCGTAIINGVPLAFANEVTRGDIGIIGASGTGMQEISCLISRCGRGISQALGVGGRDLKEEVGGISTLMALDVLDADPDTRHIILVSKPPARSVAAAILNRVSASGKDFTICYLGASELELPVNATLAPTLKAAAESALGGNPVAVGFDAAESALPLPEGKSRVAGLFSGGTLCAEAQFIFRQAKETLCSNAPVPGVGKLGESGNGHCFIDLGEDQYTRGRPHPMIDPAVRDEALFKVLGDPDVGIVLVDVVIGYGAHHDPVGHLIASLADRQPDGPLVIASVTGTDADIQHRSAQVERLTKAGVLVGPSNADAALLALACLRRQRG